MNDYTRYEDRFVIEPLPKLNVDLLDKTLDHIKMLVAFEADGCEMDEHWDQNWWGTRNECGTSLCFAGWAVKLAGYVLAPRKENNQFNHRGGDDLGVDVDGDDRHIAHVARQELGLTLQEKNLLFSSGNNLAALEATVDHIKAGRRS